MSMYKTAVIACFSALSLWFSGGLAAQPTPAPPAPLVGLADIHNHQFSNLGFGGLAVVGSAWDYSEGLALNSGTDFWLHGPGHSLDPLVWFDGPKPGPFANSGYPHYDGWPRWSSIDHQQVYYEWLKQAYDGGLRLMSVLAVSNEVLCTQLRSKKGIQLYRDCLDMPAVDRQIDAANALEAFIDRQSGGPGKGWYRIARSSKDARAIVAQGKLAVVLGVEVSNLFGCNKNKCREADVDHGVDKLYAMGVRQVFIVHEFDNDFAGAAMFLNSLNYGNYLARNEYFKPEECSQDKFTYKFQPNAADFLMSLYLGVGMSPKVSRYTADCNSRGLTPLGKYLVKRLMDKKMIVDVDHMSNEATNDTLDIAESYQYPVISSHTNILGAALKTDSDNQQSEYHKTDKQLQRIRGVHGLVAPILQTYKHEQTNWKFKHLPFSCDYCSEEWAQRYLYAIEKGPWPGIPIGSDFNGVIHHVAPRPAQATSGGSNADGVIHAWAPRPAIADYNTATKVWAYSADGLAHIGLLPAFIQDLRDIGLTDRDLAPLANGAEAYVEMWERIDSIPLAKPERGGSR
jgi:microsomal dipeptidase-like Zn-dependent dipeptidase